MVRRTVRATNHISSADSTQTPSQPGIQVTGRASEVAVTQSGPRAFPATPYDPSIPLLTTNALVRFSQVSGNLDYNGYVEYLTRLGHVRSPINIPQGLVIPGRPLHSSALQSLRGDRTDGLTDYRPDQAVWSQDDMPEIIYVFDKPSNWLGKADLKEPPTKTYPIQGKLLRDIPILPDHISPDVEGWRYEAWHRMDPRIKKEDIEDRMPLASVGRHNAKWSMRVQRFRENANVLGWVSKGGKFAREKQRLTQLLLAAGVPLASNTTRGITWGAVPSGLRIPVPAKLRWESCVEPAPTQAPPGPAVPPVANNSVPPHGPAMLPPFARVPSAPGPALSRTPPVTTTVKTGLTRQRANIQVPQAGSAHRTQGPVYINIPSPSPSSQPQLPPSITPAPRQSSGPNLVHGHPIPRNLLDPQISHSHSRGQDSTFAHMNPLPSLPGRASPPVNRGSRRSASTLTAPAPDRITGRGADTQRPHSRAPGLLPARSSGQGAVATSSANPGTDAPNDRRKRIRDDGEEEADDARSGNERAFKKPRGARPAAGSSESQRRFRTRFPRTAFGGITQDMPQSLSEWIAVSNASHVAEQARLARDGQIQPARASDGYHQTHIIYLGPGSGVAVAAPEDFLHPDGVGVGRQRRQGRWVRETNGVNAGGQLWVQGAEGVPVDYYHMNDDAHTEAHLDTMLARAAVEYTAEEMGWYLSQLSGGDSHILAQDPRGSNYPPP